MPFKTWRYLKRWRAENRQVESFGQLQERDQLTWILLALLLFHVCKFLRFAAPRKEMWWATGDSGRHTSRKSYRDKAPTLSTQLKRLFAQESGQFNVSCCDVDRPIFFFNFFFFLVFLFFLVPSPFFVCGGNRLMCGTGCGHLPEDEGHHFFFSSLARSLFFSPSGRRAFFPSLCISYLTIP